MRDPEPRPVVVAPPPPPRTPIPARLPSVMTDRLVWLVGRMADMQLHCVVTLGGRLDEARLARAVRLLLDAEPVLGCRYVPTRYHPRWERRADLDRYPLVTVVRSERPLAQCVPFMTMPCVAERDPIVQARVFRGETDVLCLKLNHFAMDGGGSKACAYLLASIYSRLAAEPGFRPEPNLAGRRSARQVSERFDLAGKLRMLRYGLWATNRRLFPRRYWAVPCAPGVRGARAPGPGYVFRRIGAAPFRALKAYGRGRGATVNDVVVAAYYRALVEHLRPADDVPLRLRTTVDLRRYLPGDAEAICNLSAFVYPNIGPGRPASFDEALRRVRDEMSLHKRDLIGLGDYALAAPVAVYLPFSGLSAVVRRLAAGPLPGELLLPGLTNIGRLDRDRLRFAELEARDAFVTASVAYPPMFVPAVTGCGESLTISVGHCESGIPRAAVERLLDSWVAALPT